MDSILVQLITAAAPGEEISITSLLAKASPVVQGVLVVLVLMSFVSWYIIIYKWRQLRQAEAESQAFLEVFWGEKNFGTIRRASEELISSPLGHVFRAGQKELDKLRSGKLGDTMQGQMDDLDNVERALRRAMMAETIHLESMVSFLATTASAAPFVGLFGTVWGIMSSFMNIAREGDASLLTVAPGIAEALIATAIGLVAAIPAVIAYNAFASRLRFLEAEMEKFGADFLNIVKRNFLS
jgi:biopolymer transport protein TolQ